MRQVLAYHVTFEYSLLRETQGGDENDHDQNSKHKKKERKGETGSIQTMLLCGHDHHTNKDGRSI